MIYIKKRIVSVAGAVILTAGCLNLGGCMNTVPNDSAGQSFTGQSSVEVITAEAVYKYEQRHSFSETEKKREIIINAAANEYESAQIIICASEDAISGYDMETSDFTTEEGAKISAENVSVYSAHYNSISNSQNGYPGGYVPDVLIPLEDRISYGDNAVAAGENQALWITFYIPKGTAAGEYKGKFKVTADSQEYFIPVKINVYPFELPDETHVKSAFAIWGPSNGNDMLTNLYGNKAKVAEEAYYEFLLKYRVASTGLPNLDLSSPEKWVEKALKYAARKEVPSFSLPFRNGTNGKYHAGWFDSAFMTEVLSLLVDRSTEELNVFDKLYAYGVVDEPDYTGEYEKTRDFTAEMQIIIRKVLTQKEQEGAFVDKPSVREGLKNLKTLITIGSWGKDLGDLGENITGYVPKFFLFDDENIRKEFKNLQKNGVGIWAYGCNVPGWPYPTYQTDSDLISPRSLGVMQMRYNIEGNLFWCANLSKVFSDGRYGENWDPYKTAYAFASWPGDGYLLAPAGRYGKRSLAPYPTMRLEVIRDGQEDYEYLYLLKNLVAQKGQAAAEALEIVLEQEYDKVLTGAKPTEKPENMIKFKEKIAELILENLGDA